MDNTNTDDKEQKDTATEIKSAENKSQDSSKDPNAGSSDTNQDQKKEAEELDQKLKDKAAQVEQLSRVAKDLTESVRESREFLRQVEETKSNQVDNLDYSDDLNLTEDQRIEKIVDKKLSVQREGEREHNIKIAFDRFKVEHPEYDPDSDTGFLKYDDLKAKADKMILGDSVDEIMGNLEFIHLGLTGNTQSQDSASKEEDVDDSGIGDTTRVNKKNENPKTLTRKLNPVEEANAARYPGDENKGFPPGEKGYRMRLAELEE